MEVFLGIDLGTTTTLAARAIESDAGLVSVTVLSLRQKDGRGEELDIHYLPSVAYFPKDGAPIVGKEAETRGPEEDVSRFVRAVKRQMGRRVLLPVVEKEPHEVSALYLEYALREGRYSLPVADTVFTVTVPASFTTNQRADTLEALRIACQVANLPFPESDAGQLFISEPVAAALAFLNQELSRPQEVQTLDLSRKNRILVYDIGGGTLDLTLIFIEPQKPNVHSLADLRINVDTVGYYNPFGGEDFDRALAQKLHERLLARFPELKTVILTSPQRLGVRLQLMNLAKKIKEELSEQMDQGGPFDFLDIPAEEPSHFYHGVIRVPGRPTTYSLEGEMTAAEYRQIIQGLLKGESRKSLITPLRDLLKKTQFDPARLDGLLIVGGMARLPLVAETVREFWGNDRVWVYEPSDHAVVTGAAIYSYLRRRHPGYILDEPAADAYYVRLKDRFDLILPAREKLGERKRYELDGDADHIRLQIFAGEDAPGGQVNDEVLPTLIHQGGTTVALGKVYKRGTPVWIQMSYAGEAGSEDHSKVPWVHIWIEKDQGQPLFRRRYNELLKGARNGKGV
jgi:molecular chaperone DnaK (HSP70)